MIGKSSLLAAGFLTAIATTSVAAAAPFFPKKYTLPDGDFTSKTVCGLEKCVIYGSGTPFHLYITPFSPDIESPMEPISAARAVIGYMSVDASGGTPLYCSKSGTHPFKPEDVKFKRSASGREVDYTRDVKIAIDVSGAVKADLDNMNALGLIPPGKLDDVKATLQAAYQGVSGSSYKAKGTFYEFALADNVYRDLWQTDKYKECADMIRRGEGKLINAAGVLWLTIDLTQGTTSAVAAQAETRLKAQGVSYDVHAAMSRNIAESLKSHTADLYQVLVWHLIDKDAIKAIPSVSSAGAD